MTEKPHSALSSYLDKIQISTWKKLLVGSFFLMIFSAFIYFFVYSSPKLIEAVSGVQQQLGVITPTLLPTATLTPTPTATLTPTPTNTPTPRPTRTPTSTAKATPTANPTSKPEVTNESPHPTSDPKYDIPNNLPPVMRVSYPTEGQMIKASEYGGGSRNICVVDAPVSGTGPGLQKKSNINSQGWGEYKTDDTTCFDMRDGENHFQLKYKNQYGLESQDYNVSFTYKLNE